MTPAKQSILRYIMGAQSSIMRNLSDRPFPVGPRYCGIDLTAGDGGTDEDPGSPIIMVEAAGQMTCPVDLFLCERNPATMALLADRIGSVHSSNCRVHLLPGDHKDRVSEIVSFVRAHPADWFGVLYFDANGGALPVSVINELVTAPGLGRLDVLAHVTAVSGYKRIRAVGLSERSFRQDVAAIRKQTTLISRPLGHQQWTFVYWTNQPRQPRFGRYAFVDLRTAEGQARMEVLEHSKRELQRRNQTALPFDCEV